MKKRIKQVVSTLALMFGLTACSNFSAGNLFSHYSAQQVSLHQSIDNGEYQQAVDLADNNVAGNILDNMERGRVSLLNGDTKASIDWLNQSDAAVGKQQDKAIISLSDTANSLSALTVNDNLTDYTPADYELGFLHLYLALNYIHNNQLDDALVEFRRANKIQETAKKIRDASLEREASIAKEQGVSANVGAILARYPNVGKRLGAIQNGYLFFLSGLMFETAGNLNDAYIDFKRALAVDPDNRSVAESVIRCAQKLGMHQDLDTLTKRYGSFPALRKQQSRVIIIQEQGTVDVLRGWRQSLPLYDSQGHGVLYSLALPFYAAETHPNFEQLQLNHTQLKGESLADVNLMARNQLQERITSIVFRQILRVVIKEQLRQQTSKDDQLVGVLFNAWSALTEQPDTRSWLTLPGSVYSISRTLSAGKQTLSIGSKSYEFETPARGTTLVWISRQGNHSVVWHKQLGKL